MKKAWTVLLISAVTDFAITAGTAWMALSGSDKPVTRNQVITVLVGGGIALARTIQQALKATPETSAALMGDASVVATSTVVKTP